MRRRKQPNTSLIAALLACIALLTTAATASPSPTQALVEPQSATSNPQFGIAGTMRWPTWGTFNLPADLFLQTGAGWTREDFVWGLIEPRPNTFDWTATDRIVATLAERNVNVLGIIAYSASWATPTSADDGAPTSFYPPDPDRYYTFVKTLVARYKGSVHHWEVWNEPDNQMFWKPAPDPRQYAALLKTAYRAVKDADPGAKVLSGGVSGNAIPFLEEMVAAGAGSSFDILALHPYAVPLDPAQGRVESRPEVHKLLDVEMNKYRAFLQRHQLDKPVWITEIGWPAQDWGLDDAQQANYLAQTYALLLSGGIPERIFWYSFKDQSGNPRDSWGLVAWGNNSTDLNPTRQSFRAYAAAARTLAGAAPGGRIQLAPFSNVVDFEQPATWNRSTSDRGSFATSTDQAHGGSASGKLQYTFTAPSQAVDFAPPQPVALPGTPTRIGLWALGDASGDYLSAWLRDRDGELFKVRLGAVTGSADGWRYFESAINTYYFGWEKAGGSPSNGRPDYPLSFVSFRLENTPDEPAGSGTIYVDDLQTFDGADATAVRFTKPDGSVVDVLWSASPAQVNLPTASGQAQVVGRDGAETTTAAKNGAIPLNLSDSPVYVLHRPAKAPVGAIPNPQPQPPAPDPNPPAPNPQAPNPQAPAGPNPQSPLCLAAPRTGDAASWLSGSRYFPQTGHNLAPPFRAYWEARGGIDIFGYPITEGFDAPSTDGKVYKQQYFERARFEYHPENRPPADVQLGLLGTWAARDRNVSVAPQGQRPAQAQFFPETGQWLLTFKTWWNANGGLPTFGYPISPELQERNAADGKTYTVQYFERNRLEKHPEFAGSPKEVLLGLLGTEYLARQGCR